MNTSSRSKARSSPSGVGMNVLFRDFNTTVSGDLLDRKDSVYQLHLVESALYGAANVPRNPEAGLMRFLPCYVDGRVV